MTFVALEEFSNPDDESTLTCSSNRDDSIVSVDQDKLQRISLLGRGKFCNVHLVAGTLSVSPQHQSTSEKVKPYDQDAQNQQKAFFACKSIDPTSSVSDPDRLIVAASDLASEAKMLSQLDHENIIKLHGYKCSETVSKCFLVLDLLTETLSQRLIRWRKDEDRAIAAAKSRNKKNRQRFLSLCNTATTTTDGADVDVDVDAIYIKRRRMYGHIKDVLLGIARGMEYLSSRNIVLRDLKPDNIGFDDDGNVRLFDFGFARSVEECDPKEICGSPRYLAPEVVAGKGYSLKVDVYSFGVLFFEVCSLKVPFKEYFDNNHTNSKRSFYTLSLWKKLVKNHSRCRRKNTDTILQQRQLMTKEFYRCVVETELRPMDDLELSVIPCPLIRSLIEECWHADAEKRPTFQEILTRLEALLDHRGR
ncbi:MAG: serine/threonine protein kinase [Bacillariaceae sp.]|jgi:serine/threonine protein kinase